MQVAVQIPLKARDSQRVPGKNFRDIAGKPLFAWLCDELAEHAPASWRLYIDSECESVMKPIRARYGERFQFHLREDWYASDEANGNHLINQFAVLRTQYDIIAQAFVTAVGLRWPSIAAAVAACEEPGVDTVTYAEPATGWYWLGNGPVNYDREVMNGLPRSQDAKLMKETTGIYVARREHVLRHGTRAGGNLMVLPLTGSEAMDIDTMEDFAIAESILKGRQ
jgi:CMP-N-acetylneuraminic acid synthetase